MKFSAPTSTSSGRGCWAIPRIAREVEAERLAHGLRNGPHLLLDVVLAIDEMGGLGPTAVPVSTGATLALVVPSVIVPQEANHVLNVSHPQFARIELSARESFSFDERLWRTRFA